MVIGKQESKKGAGRMTFYQARESTETSTGKVNRGWTARGRGKKVKR
jgi:hypothetical protein